MRLGRGVDSGLVRAVEGNGLGSEDLNGWRRWCGWLGIGGGEGVRPGREAGPDDTPADGQSTAAEQAPPGQRPVGRTHQPMVIGLALEPGL
ncbi:hypothetical protein Ais01nite_73100 [Asanoa ishikariensis]|nr:hypothetical protein Ais01nite_73100 [Asanoa ishikariensis]